MSQQTLTNTTQDTQPQQDDDMPNKCLTMTIKAPFAHFKRIEGTVVRQTYKIPPRTTIAGLIAAMLGYDRDTYYDVLSVENADIAITPVNEIKTINIPVNALSTSRDKTTEIVEGTRSLSVRVPDPDNERQQYNFEVITNPAYKIDVRIRDQDVYNNLKHALKNKHAHYPISLGLSEYLANITYHGEHETTPLDHDTHTIHSAIPDASTINMDKTNHKVHTERSQADFDTHTPDSHRSKRHATEYNNVAFNKNANPLIATTTATQVQNRTIKFA